MRLVKLKTTFNSFFSKISLAYYPYNSIYFRRKRYYNNINILNMIINTNIFILFILIINIFILIFFYVLPSVSCLIVPLCCTTCLMCFMMNLTGRQSISYSRENTDSYARNDNADVTPLKTVVEDTQSKIKDAVKRSLELKNRFTENPFTQIVYLPTRFSGRSRRHFGIFIHPPSSRAVSRLKISSRIERSLSLVLPCLDKMAYENLGVAEILLKKSAISGDLVNVFFESLSEIFYNLIYRTHENFKENYLEIDQNFSD